MGNARIDKLWWTWILVLWGNKGFRGILNQYGNGLLLGLEALGKGRNLHSVTVFNELKEIQRRFPSAGTSSPPAAPLLTFLTPMLAEWNIDPRWLRGCPVVSVACVCVCALLHGGSSSIRCCNKCKKTKRELISFFQLVTAANGAAAVRCRLQHSEGAARRMLRTANIGVCDIREAAARERAASTAGNRPLFYFRFGEHDECIFSSPVSVYNCASSRSLWQIPTPVRMDVGLPVVRQDNQRMTSGRPLLALSA